MDRRKSRALRHRSWAVSAIFALLATATPASPAFAAEPVEVAFAYTGAEQAFDVPAGVTNVHVVLVGGRGWDVQGGSAPAKVEGDLAVTPGARLYIEVGGDGAAGGTDPGSGAGGFNGGGAGGDYDIGFGPMVTAGGGGATDIRALPRTNADSLASRLAVAAGGGGGGTDAVGGDASQPGDGGAAGGGAGTGSVGGAPGAGTISDGSSGSAGSGGDGGSLCSGAACASGGGGGGGGGGYFGGGGGGAGFFGGGGGGGSSYTGGLTNTPGVVTLGTSTPSVTISYAGGAPGSPSGLVEAVVTMATSAVCLELSTTSIDFGTRQFGGVRQPAAPSIDIANCSAAGETILAHGSDGLGIGPTSWTLVDNGSCGAGTLATDTYRLTLQDATTSDEVTLSTANKVVRSLDAGATATQVTLIDTPCPGSSGAGVVMGMQIVFVATE